MADPGVPDSWDQSDGQDASAPLQKPLSALSFNPDAPAFVPGQNIHAGSFVPRGFGGQTGNAPAENPIATPQSATTAGKRRNCLTNK